MEQLSLKNQRIATGLPDLQPNMLPKCSAASENKFSLILNYK